MQKTKKELSEANALLNSRNQQMESLQETI